MCNDTSPRWYAIKTRRESLLEDALRRADIEVFLPRETIRTPQGRQIRRPLIPHVLFIRTTRRQAIELELATRRPDRTLPAFWIYRNTPADDIRPIHETQIRLLRLLADSTDDGARCEIYTKSDFRPGHKVRVTAGIYAGYEGTVQRVRKNRHVVVSIEGLCLILLPYIHPDLLQPID